MKSNKIIILILVFLPISFTAGNLLAADLVLCVNQEEQYVVNVNGQGDCNEREQQRVLSGFDTDKLNNLLPLANFKENTECNGTGLTTEIGFDENDNGSLEKDEIISISSSCTPTDLPE